MHEHHVRCDDCETLKSTIQAIADEIESPSVSLYSVDQKEDLKHDHKQAQEMIFHGSPTLSELRTKRELNKVF